MQKSDNNPQPFGLALQMGYLIAIPLVVFALLGRFVDSALGSSPLFFLMGILFAITCSTVLVYKKTMALLKVTEDESRIKNQELRIEQNVKKGDA
ncbi:AtpZ/AtpI family protein [Candidatus Uhrbacteria bacterium]|nr:AtpZ/AtpI family protein [Candidatus Uhrbacteria bacterium]